METSGEYQKELNAELASLQDLQEEAKLAYKEFGALCDNEGYYQHTGECWNDSFQQLMNNADGLKEIVQKGFIHMPLSLSFEIPDNIFSISEQFIQLPKEQQDLLLQGKEWLLLYWKESQKRFLRHYLTEVRRRKFLRDECGFDVPAEIAREKLRAISKDLRARRKGSEAKRAAIFGKTFISSRRLFKRGPHARPSPAKYSEDIYKLGGGTFDDISILLALYSHVLFEKKIGYKILDFNDQGDTFLTNLEDIANTSYGITVSIFDTNQDEEKASGHMISMYTCGKKEYMYDDNFGILQFNWRMFFLEYKKRKEKGENPEIKFIPVEMEEAESGFHLQTDIYPVLCYTYENKKKIVSLLICSTFMNIINTDKNEFYFDYFKNGVRIRADYRKPTVKDIVSIFSVQSAEHILVPIENTESEFQPNARLQSFQFGFKASMMSDEDLIKYIRETPLDPMMRDVYSNGAVQTPVAMLIHGERPSVALELIQRGFDVNTPYEGKASPLMWAITKKYLNVVDALLKAGADVSYVTPTKGNQAIHYAAQQTDDVQYLKLLVNAGAKINVQNHLGQTPLWLAANNNFVESVRYLCQQGADPRLSGALSKKDKPLPPVFVTGSANVRTILNECGKLASVGQKSKGGYKHTKKQKNHRRRPRQTRRSA